ncbi:phenylalanine--tRNA ligase beta subunit-related protein [Frigoribacterium sp. UYMn621]|uniref:B3/B4 domain-containing protein n=1 Tax=Frigoribacterium sp. UYMn621 TaxID=3156343 RepID=UPI0033955405
MRFTHDPRILAEFPQLTATTLHVHGVTANPDVTRTARFFLDRAAARLAGGPESELPEIAAWRRAFTQMGLKPTQYRCAPEALLRRFRKEGTLPSIHPLVDICNAVSLAYAIPIAVFETDQVVGDLTVRHAGGTETYATFAGETETPDAGEVIFADDFGNAHARRWVNRQSALSAIRPTTSSVLIVVEAMHETGPTDVAALRADLVTALREHWNIAE